MKREIKFRAWNDEEKRFNYFDFHNVITYHKQLSVCNLSGKPFQQFTGLKDKNGKDIYEGDIIKIWLPNKSNVHAKYVKAIIEYHSAAYWFKADGFTDCNWHHYNQDEREVIGNIYENPELITNLPYRE